MPTKLTFDTEHTKIKRAFQRIRDAGGYAYVGMCCGNCAADEVSDRGGDRDSTLAYCLDDDVRAAFPNGPQHRMRHALSIHHSGEARLICDALEIEGLRVVWSGDVRHTIKIRPTTLH